MNLLLHGLDAPEIDPGNALRHKLSEIGEKERVDVILTNPPFGGEEEKGIQGNFPEDRQTAETALLFLQLIMRKLHRQQTPAGRPARAAVVVPNGTLFGDGVCARIKEELLKEFNLHTIVRLPNGVFAPYTSIPTNLLFFDRSGPTRDVWYYEHPLPEGRKNYTKTAPLQFEEFAACQAWWGKREENERAWKVPAAELLANNCNLDRKNPRAKEDIAHLPPEQTRRQHPREGASHRGDHAAYPEAPRSEQRLVRSLRRAGDPRYPALIKDLSGLLETARRASARAVNALMTATYWEIGRRIVEYEQGGEKRAEYGAELLERLSTDLARRFGRGFSRQNLQYMRQFYVAFPPDVIRQTVSGESDPNIRQTASSKSETPSRISRVGPLAAALPLPWSHYVLLLGKTRSPEALTFYHAEALRGGWSVRQLDRQIASQFYERTALSRNKAAMLASGAAAKPSDALSADDQVRDPLILEFLGLKDEYSEHDMEEALIHHLESFLLELGGEFAFIGRQRRLRIGDEWYRVDLLFFHRRLRCLIVIDLKVGKFTHADAGQMHLYLNYARAHWMQPDENPPVGLILCSEKNEAIARYALEGLPSKVLAREYRLTLPAEKRLASEIEKTRQRLEAHSHSETRRTRRP